jgi:hypothetical protein
MPAPIFIYAFFLDPEKYIQYLLQRFYMSLYSLFLLNIYIVIYYIVIVKPQLEYRLKPQLEYVLVIVNYMLVIHIAL